MMLRSNLLMIILFLLAGGGAAEAQTTQPTTTPTVFGSEGAAARDAAIRPATNQFDWPTITVTPVRKVLKGKTQLVVQVVHENTTSEPFRFADNRPDGLAFYSYRIIVIDESGHQMRVTEEGAESISMGGRQVRTDLAPGASHTHYLNLPVLYGLAKGSAYRVQVEARYQRRGSQNWQPLLSNEIVFRP